MKEAAAHGVTHKVLYDQVDCQGAGGRDLSVAGANGVSNKVPDGQHETQGTDGHVVRGAAAHGVTANVPLRQLEGQGAGGWEVREAGAHVGAVSTTDNRFNDISWKPGHPDLFFQSSENLVSRHSISLMNRTPPKLSLAADILGSLQSANKTRLIVEDLKELTDKLSDFNSCVSDFSENSTGDEHEKDNSKSWNTMNEKKRHKKVKERTVLLQTRISS